MTESLVQSDFVRDKTKHTEECDCQCHTPGMRAMHIAPCCIICHHCNKRIKITSYFAHIEKVFVSAMTFYADANNWSGENAKALQDTGQLARQTLAQLEGQNVQSK